jgi:Leucine-rich repeat (LRR) protein
MTTEIETYLNSLSEDISIIDISSKNIDYIPDLTRFKNLEILNCSENQLTSLPSLPQSLEILYCSENQLTSLPTLPQNLEILYCSENQLTSLPTLPTQSLLELYYDNNPIYEIINNNRMIQINKNIKILNNFRHLYYCLKFKEQLRNYWLWEKVREPIVMKKYHPNYLLENLGDEDDLDAVLYNWIHK